MPVFRIWNADRTVKKSVVCDPEIEALRQKASQKLGLESAVGTKIVLERCGTEVDDDDVLGEFVSDVLLLLRDGDSYLPATPQQPPGSFHQKGITEESSEDSPDQSIEPSTSEVPRRPSTNLTAIPLPQLSGATKAALLEGEMSRRVWLNLIEESKNFYMKMCPQIEDTPYIAYKIIGQKMVSLYPSIKREGMHPWSQYTKALSQSIRTERFKRKRRSLPTTPQVSSRKFSVHKQSSAPVTGNESNMISEEEYLRHLLELKKEWARASPNEDHVKMLFQDTFYQRRKYLTSLPTGKVSPILEKFTCLEEGKYVLMELERLLLGSLETWIDRLDTIVAALRDKVPNSDAIKGDLLVIETMRYIENEIAFKRGKGLKSRCVFTTAESDITDADKKILCCSSERSPPRLFY